MNGAGGPGAALAAPAADLAVRGAGTGQTVPDREAGSRRDRVGQQPRLVEAAAPAALRGAAAPGTSAPALSSPAGAFATTWAAIASASLAAPRNLSARTNSRAGPS